MEVAALSPGVGVTEAPETTMPGEPDGSPREVQTRWEQLGPGCEKREGCIRGKGKLAQVVLFFSLLNTQLGLHVQGKQPPHCTHSCQLHLVWGWARVPLDLCPLVFMCVLLQSESGWQLWLSELRRVLQRQL